MSCQIVKRSTVIVKQTVIPISGFLFIIYVQYWCTVDNHYSELLNFINSERQTKLWYSCACCLIHNSSYMHSILGNGTKNKKREEISKI